MATYSRISLSKVVRTLDVELSTARTARVLRLSDHHIRSRLPQLRIIQIIQFDSGQRAPAIADTETCTDCAGSDAVIAGNHFDADACGMTLPDCASQ